MAAHHNIPEDKPRRTLIIVVAVIAAVVIGGAFYLLFRGTMSRPQTTQLPDAVRPGSPEWEQYSKRIVLDEPVADEAKRPLGDTVMTLQTTVRNFIGRTIVGLEIRGLVVDHDGKPVKERVLVVIPGRQPELEPNKTMKASILLEGFTESDDRANIKMEVTAFKLR
jgi:hypothetical protein